MRVPEPLKELYDAAMGQDWRVEKGSHGLIWLPPDRSKPMVTTPCSKGIEGRTLRNIRSELRRSGLVYSGRRRAA